MKVAGFFLFGFVAGMAAALAFERSRKGESSEDYERLSGQVSKHLSKLERRLDKAMKDESRA